MTETFSSRFFVFNSRPLDRWPYEFEAIIGNNLPIRISKIISDLAGSTIEKL